MPRPTLETVPEGIAPVSLDRIADALAALAWSSDTAKLERIVDLAFGVAMASGDGYTVVVAKQAARDAIAALERMRFDQSIRASIDARKRKRGF